MRRRGKTLCTAWDLQAWATMGIGGSDAGRMWGILVVFVLPLGLLGCGGVIKQPAKSATLGALDALQDPPRDARLAGKLGKLVERYLDAALAASPPPGIDEISRKAAKGAAQGLGEVIAEDGGRISGAARQSLRGAVGAVSEEAPAIGRFAARTGSAMASGLVRGIGRDQETVDALSSAASGAGKALASGVSEEMAAQMSAWVGPDARGPLAEAMAVLAARSSKAAVEGAMAALRQELVTCVPGQGDPCMTDIARTLSRSAARGVGEGVRKGIDWLAASVAFAIGLVVAAIVWFLMNVIRGRKRMTAG